MILGSENDQEVTYWYEGICPSSGARLRLPRTWQAEAIAKDLMQKLSKIPSWTKPNLTQLSLWEGKMYGILLVELPTGEQAVLKAFSGLLNGESEIAGWVPPIAGREKIALEESLTLASLDTIKQKLIELSQIPARSQYQQRSLEYAAKLQTIQEHHQISKQQRKIKRSQLTESSTTELVALRDLVRYLDHESQQEKRTRQDFKRDRDQILQPLQEAIALADLQMQALKQQRRELSRTLQTQMHNAYVLTNFAGETRSLRQLITEGSMPTGMGDCCAPKLLDYAAKHNFTPVAMAEFWWGSPSADGYKIQSEFYGACVERCQPLMGFLLSGKHAYSAIVSKETLESSLPIIYEDEYLIAIAKPAGLLSVPGRYLDTQDSVLSRLRQLLGDAKLIYPVHRLDRQTSGILLFARDLETLRDLNQQFQRRQIHKIYEALLSGQIISSQIISSQTKSDRGTIDLPLWGNPENRPYQQVDFQRGKPSITQFQVLKPEASYPRIEFIPLTGRTHQLRVHAADPQGLGITILGDRLYGCNAATTRLHLHARELSFRHPRSLEIIHLQIPVPF